jgi:hypothetical protein
MRGWPSGRNYCLFRLQLLILQSLPSIADVLVDPQSFVNGQVSGLLSRRRVMPAGEQARRDGADIGDVLFVRIHKGLGGVSFEKCSLFLTPQSRELFVELTTEVASHCGVSPRQQFRIPFGRIIKDNKATHFSASDDGCCGARRVRCLCGRLNRLALGHSDVITKHIVEPFLLSKQPGSNLSPGRLSRRSRRWGYIPGLHPALPSIALTNINTGKESLELYRIAGLALKSQTPFSAIISLIASRAYTVRGILIGRC